MEIRDDVAVGGMNSQVRPRLKLLGHWLGGWSLLALVTSSGCAICCGPYDYDFGAYGGVRERIDRQHGRVGSILDPAQAAGTEQSSPVSRSFVPAAGFRPRGEDEPSPCDEDEPETEDGLRPIPRNGDKPATGSEGDAGGLEAPSSTPDGGSADEAPFGSGTEPGTRGGLEDENTGAAAPAEDSAAEGLSAPDASEPPGEIPPPSQPGSPAPGDGVPAGEDLDLENLFKPTMRRR